MSLLWTKAARYAEDPEEEHNLDEEHDEHSLHPIFEAAGLDHAPCAYPRCPEFDQHHSDVFDKAERRAFQIHDDGKRPPVERVDLLNPRPKGFEKTVDRRTLLKYQKDPTSRGHLPVFFRHHGEHYIFNGHHGTSAALRRGDTHMDVHMIDLDKED